MSLPFVDRLCPHRSVARIVDELPAEGDILVHCKVSEAGADARPPPHPPPPLTRLPGGRSVGEGMSLSR